MLEASRKWWEQDDLVGCSSYRFIQKIVQAYGFLSMTPCVAKEITWRLKLFIFVHENLACDSMCNGIWELGTRIFGVRCARFP